MSGFKNLAGMHFGKLTVISRAENKNGRVHWNCICDCGTACVVMSKHLISGHTQSCGCLSLIKLAERACTHQMTNTKIYQTWCGIKTRCLNPNCKQYRNYGGRGITIFSEWINDFTAFYNYVSKLPNYGEKGYTLDRIDNNGNYEPNNLRWADPNAQSRNKRNNIWVEYKGQKMILKDVAKLCGVSYNTLYKHYKRGWSLEKLFGES